MAAGAADAAGAGCGTAVGAFLIGRNGSGFLTGADCGIAVGAFLIGKGS